MFKIYYNIKVKNNNKLLKNTSDRMLRRKKVNQ